MATINIYTVHVVLACEKWYQADQDLSGKLLDNMYKVQSIMDLAAYCQQESMTIDHNDYSLIGDYLPI